MRIYHCDQGPIKDGIVYNRTTLINHCIKKFKYKTYLEIGYGHGDNWNSLCEIEDKTCVDPYLGPDSIVKKTSDDFFKENKKMYDLIFIDGDHSAEQVYKDVMNSLKFLNEDGIIIMHDCNPPERIHEYNGACGTAWRVIPWLRKIQDLDACVFIGDLGTGLLKKRKNQNCISIEKDDYFSDKLNKFLESKEPNFEILDYEILDNKRINILNLLDLEDVLDWL